MWCCIKTQYACRWDSVSHCSAFCNLLSLPLDTDMRADTGSQQSDITGIDDVEKYFRDNWFER